MKLAMDMKPLIDMVLQGPEEHLEENYVTPPYILTVSGPQRFSRTGQEAHARYAAYYKRLRSLGISGFRLREIEVEISN